MRFLRWLAALSIAAAALVMPQAAAAVPLPCAGGGKYRVTVMAIDGATVYDGPTSGTVLGRLGFGTQFCNYAGTHNRYLVHTKPGWWVDRNGLEWGTGTGAAAQVDVATFGSFNDCADAARNWWFNGGSPACNGTQLYTKVPG